MMKTNNRSISLVAFLSAVLFSSAVLAAPMTDIQDTSTQTATTYFSDTADTSGSNPYYRWWNEDWGWTHNAIAGAFTTISLDIGAYDIDYPSCGIASYCEEDAIEVYNGTSWTNVGLLSGADSTWSFTGFNLAGYSWAQAQVNAGLQVRIDIDSTNTSNSRFWAVLLSKSVLNVDGGTQECSPVPGVPCTPAGVPEPSSTGLLILGLGLLGLTRLKRLQRR